MLVLHAAVYPCGTSRRRAACIHAGPACNMRPCFRSLNLVFPADDPMNVLMLAPGYPAEMPLFARALKWQGAAVYGLSDVAEHELPDFARRQLAGYLRVPMTDEDRAVAMVREWRPVSRFDRVICMWEPGVILAAKMREALGVDGMGVEQATLFRYKDKMNEAIAASGIGTPRHGVSTTIEGVSDEA